MRHYKVKGWELFIFVLDPGLLQTALREIELERGEISAELEQLRRVV